MTAARGIARNAGYLAAARIATQAGNALLFFAIGRTLGFEQLGLYAAAISFFQIIAISGAAASTTSSVRWLNGRSSPAATWCT